MDSSSESAEASASSAVDSGVTSNEDKKNVIYEPYPANVPGKKRGIATIFNQETFRYRLKKRKGSNNDTKRLKSILQQLGFKVKTYTNRTMTQIRKKLAKIASMDHTNNECLLICVMTHGEPGMLAASDSCYYAVHELWSPFTEERCPSLKGKPKIFFIQACRGKITDEGIALKLRRSLSEQPRTETTATDAVPTYTPENFNDFVMTLLNALPTETYEELYNSQKWFQFFQSLPGPSQSSQSNHPSRSYQSYRSDATLDIGMDDRLEEADFFVAYATFYGHFSYRGETRGSWFIQELCNILENCGEKYSLTTLMTFVGQRVAIKYIPNKSSDESTSDETTSDDRTPNVKMFYEKQPQIKTQMSCIVNTLTRPFYFYPELSEDVPDNLEDILGND